MRNNGDLTVEGLVSDPQAEVLQPIISPGEREIEGEEEEEEEYGLSQRTGNVWTSTAHIITAVIGSGVLSLAWSIAQMGWIAGSISLLAFALITCYTNIMLADCYRSPDPVLGKRNPTYIDAVRSTLGGVHAWLCGIAQYTNLFGTCIGYIVTTTMSMIAIQRTNCFHHHGFNAHCDYSGSRYMLLFGAVQMILSQIPDFDKIWWLSIIAAIMSFSYSAIGAGLSIEKALDSNTSIVNIENNLTQVEKFWFFCQALGDIAFAYAYSQVSFEIQNTIKAPPAENKTMKRATFMGVGMTTVFFMSCGCFGYAAFGSETPGNLLIGFEQSEYYWLVHLANICIVVHLIGAYQLYSQPIFSLVEQWVLCKHLKTWFFRDQIYSIQGYGRLHVNAFKALWRIAFVMLTTSVAFFVPFFNDILGIVGAIGFWPLGVYFPIEMYIKQTRMRQWTLKWSLLQLLSLFCLIVSIIALIGSVEGVIKSSLF